MATGGGVLVQVVPVAPNQQISWGGAVTESLQDRIDDIRGAIRAAFETVSAGLGDLSSPEGWEIGELSASFGLTLSAQAGVIVSKASLGSTFDVTVTFRRAGS